MSRRQLSKIYPGVIYLNRREEKWFDRLLEIHGRCQACGSKKNLKPHHINPCHVYDKAYFDVDNGAVLCESCHNRYHNNCFPVNDETFQQFCREKPHNKGKSKRKRKRKRKNIRKYKRKKYESSPLYSKIRINDFTKPKPKPKVKKRKRKRKRSKKKMRFNPIFLTKEWGSDDWDYLQRMELEKEVLGDYYE